MSHPVLVFNPAFLRARGGGAPSGLVAYVVATLSSDNTGMTTGDQTITWTAEVEDSGWGWSPSGTVFTVPSGVEYVVVNASARQALSSGDFNLQIQLNGSAMSINVQDNQSNGQVSTGYQVLSVTAGDEISITVWSDDSSWTLLSGASETFVSIAGYAS